MDLALKGKVVFVAGASRGIGAAIARLLVAESARVFAVARGADDLDRLRAELGPLCETFCADLSDEEGIRAAVAEAEGKCGPIDALVCNVGSGTSVPCGEETIAEWRRMLDVNLLSSAATIRAAWPQLKRTKGAIVCISSICGSEALGAPPTYSAAKAALNQYVRECSRVFARDEVRINAVSPGNVFFPGGSWEKKMAKDPTGVNAYIERDVPLRRFGKPEEIARACAFLISPVSSFTTGSNLIVDGGQSR